MYKIKVLILVVSLVLLHLVGNTQEPTRSKNSAFLELLGNGGLFSVNYERNLVPNISFRLGFGSWTSGSFLGGPSTKVTTIPVMLNYITGQRKSHFELSGGFLFGNKRENGVSDSIFDLTSFCGYRYQALGNGLLFRIGLASFWSLDNSANYPDKDFIVAPGISLGYHF